MHLLEASREGIVPHKDYDIFKDRDNHNNNVRYNGKDDNGNITNNTNTTSGQRYSYLESFQLQNNINGAPIIVNNTVPFNCTPERSPHLNDKVRTDGQPTPFPSFISTRTTISFLQQIFQLFWIFFC